MTHANTCIVCDARQDGQRSFCALCGGLTTQCQKELAPYEPVDLLVRWEAGSLYRGKVNLDLPESESKSESKPGVGREEGTTSPEVWIFTYDEEIVHTPALIRLQQEDRKLAQLPHPNLPKQLDRGHVGHRPYLIFEGQPMALPLPTWRPNLPNHVLSSIFSRLAELVLLLQSAGIQRPVIDPYRLMVFWNEENDLLDFRWLPLPELGNYLYREGFTPTSESSDANGAVETAQTAHPLLHPVEPVAFPEDGLAQPKEQSASVEANAVKSPREAMLEAAEHAEFSTEPGGAVSDAFGEFEQHEITADVPSLKAITKRLSETDDFELMTVLEELGESSEDLEAMARRLADLEKEGKIPPLKVDSTDLSSEASEALGVGAEEWLEAARSKTDKAEPLSSSDASLEGMHAAEEGSDISLSQAGRSLPAATHGLGLPAVAPSSPSIDRIVALDPSASPFNRRGVPSPSELAAALHPPDDEPTQPGERPFLMAYHLSDGDDPSWDGSKDVEIAAPVFLKQAAKESPEATERAAEGTASSPSHDALESLVETFPTSTKVPVMGQIVVHYHPKLRVQDIHSLDVSLQRDERSKGDEPPGRVQVTPVFPGCIVSPAQVWLDQWDEQARFWITPMVSGDLRESAALQVQSGDTSLSSIALPCISQKAGTPRLLSIVAIVVAMLAMIPPPSSHQGLFPALWLFFHHWGLTVAGVLAIGAMVTRWWPKPLVPTVTRTAFSIES